jgi:hypothetical protein
MLGPERPVLLHGRRSELQHAGEAVARADVERPGSKHGDVRMCIKEAGLDCEPIGPAEVVVVPEGNE